MNNNTIPLQINIPSTNNLGGTAQFLVDDVRRGKGSQQISNNGKDDNFNEYLDTTIPHIMNITPIQNTLRHGNKLKLTLWTIHIL